MDWYLKVWQQYADFDGRARRKEYWMFHLFHVLALIAAVLLDNLLDMAFFDGFFGPIYLVYVLASVIPSLAVTVRRLHDVDKSGGMIFISMIPIVGPIWLLVLQCTKGDQGRNRYGRDPKEA
ncbi:DUF805 domain-containing protein [Algoriphagus sp. H41]|uniref:DUF805 domain-containing protein n=1 Tax=Algoriphagus oliviformis TaxID=2811231 RepID=A0ABS3C294_9BACT|nr:DUF805 domain-containing protein [Algoriphagus oliviformis]MBN7810295.1 DUF805 domain-containing protein [Algoriphagus oliviformis]